MSSLNSSYSFWSNVRQQTCCCSFSSVIKRREIRGAFNLLLTYLVGLRAGKKSRQDCFMHHGVSVSCIMEFQATSGTDVKKLYWYVYHDIIDDVT
jgi:hypothetical protein